MIIAPVSSPYSLSNMPQLPASAAATRYAVSSASLPVVSSGLASQAMNPSLLSQLNRSSLHFSGCFCPICASMAIIVESHEKVKKIQSGDGIIPGETMQQIVRKTGFNYIPHSRATRLAFPSQADVSDIEKAAMNRTVQANGTVRLDIPSEDSLFTTVSSSLMTSPLKVPQYEPHRNDLLFSPMTSDVVTKTASALKPNEYQVMTILHHMQNVDDRVTKPMSLGYMLAGQVVPDKKELAVMSIRPIPRFENMLGEPAGLGNLLSSMAADKQHSYDSVAVAVESTQPELKSYLQHLNDLGVTVKRYVSANGNQQPNGVAVEPMPKSYEVALGKLYPQSMPGLYTVDLKPLRDWLDKGLPADVLSRIHAKNPDLSQELKTLAKEQKLPEGQLSPASLFAVLAPPAPPGARKPIPRDS